MSGSMIPWGKFPRGMCAAPDRLKMAPQASTAKPTCFTKRHVGPVGGDSPRETRNTQLNSLSRPSHRIEATRFLCRTNRWRRLLPVDVGRRGRACTRSACVAAAAQISRPSTNPEAKSRLRRTPARRADALVLSANAWPLTHALPSGPCLRQGGVHCSALGGANLSFSISLTTVPVAGSR